MRIGILNFRITTNGGVHEGIDLYHAFCELHSEEKYSQQKFPSKLPSVSVASKEIGR